MGGAAFHPRLAFRFLLIRILLNFILAADHALQLSSTSGPVNWLGLASRIAAIPELGWQEARCVNRRPALPTAWAGTPFV